MGQYGRHVSPRTSPLPHERKGRNKTGASPILQWTPVTTVGQTKDAADLRTPFVKAAEAATLVKGVMGLAVWDEGYHNYDGVDPVLNRANDVTELIPALTPAQMVIGSTARIEYRNYADDLHDGQREYAGRNMFKPADCASLAIGSPVAVGAGDDTNGYFKIAGSAATTIGIVDEFEFDDDDLGFVVIQFHL